MDETPLGKEIKKDLETLEKIRKEMKSLEYKKSIISKIDNYCDDRNIDRFSDWELEVAEFEFLTIPNKSKTPGIHQILTNKKKKYKPSASALERSIESMLETYDIGLNQTDPFSKILILAFIELFPNFENFWNGEEINESIWQNEFDNFWNNLSEGFQAIVQYVENALKTNIVPALPFLLKDFSLPHFQEYFTDDPQPDSGASEKLRQISTLACYYAQAQFNQKAK